MAISSLLLVATGTGSNAAAEPVATNSFLKLSHEERYWWIHGAVMTMAHLVAIGDQRKGDCVAKWYRGAREARQKLIEDTLEKYPSESATTIVISLLTQACGELIPAAAR